jgi:hypothetical protein
MATGSPGTNGVWQYGEDDSEATFSALLNKAASTTDTAIGVDRGRLTTLEARPLAGLIPVVPSSVVIAGGSGSANSLGLVTFTTGTAVSLNGVFTSTYQNYRIIANYNGSTTGDVLYIRVRASGTDASGGNYFGGINWASQGGSGVINISSQTQIDMGRVSNLSGVNGFSLDISNPQLARATRFNFQSTGYQPVSYFGFNGGVIHTLNNAYDGFTIYPAAGNITGTIQVFGYND